MSSSLSPPSLSSPFIHGSSTYRHGTKLFLLPHSTSTRKSRCFKSFSSKCSLDDIPKQFRQENLKDGLMDNYKNTPKFLYGLTPSQMDMFLNADNPMNKMSERVTEESISSAQSYLANSGIASISGMDNNGSKRYSMGMSANMYRGGWSRRRNTPPDLPSLLLDNRIVFLGMPIVPAVSELIVAQLLYLDFIDNSEPIYLYINSHGTQNENKEIVGSETDAYAIVDMMRHIKPAVYTINISAAFGQAAMLLAIGKKGKRAILQNASTKVYLPKCHRSSGSVADMWIKAKELETSTENYLKLLSYGTMKPREELVKELRANRFFLPQEAVDFGLADRVLNFGVDSYDKPEYKAWRERRDARLLKKRGGRNLQASPSEF